MSEKQFKLSSPPGDGITSLCFSGDSHLLASSWDSGVCLYNTGRGASEEHLIERYAHRAAVMDCCFVDRFTAASAGLSREIKTFDFNTHNEEVVGSHSDTVKCLNFSAEHSALLSASWDSTLKLWDLRSRSAQTFDLPGKAYTMDAKQNMVIVGTAERHVWLFDLRNMAEPIQRRISSLKFQTRVIRLFNDLTGYALGSVEGRVAVEYVDVAPEIQAKKYAFKCHRTKKDGQELVYPVNTIAVQPVYGTFATGGGDGVVSIWDGKFKKRIHQCKGYPTSIAALAFNGGGTQVAIASSYTFEEGDKPHEPDAIYIRAVKDTEVQPRPSKAK